MSIIGKHHPLVLELLKPRRRHSVHALSAVASGGSLISTADPDTQALHWAVVNLITVQHVEVKTSTALGLIRQQLVATEDSQLAEVQVYYITPKGKQVVGWLYVHYADKVKRLARRKGK